MIAVGKRPKGPCYLLDDTLRDRIIGRLDELDWLDKDLASAVGVSKGAISRLIRHPGRHYSRLIPSICQALDIPPPELYDDPLVAEIVRLLGAASVEERRQILALLQLMSRKSRQL